MQSTWGSLTIGADPVRISTAQLKAVKLMIQSAPGNTGNIKIGAAGLTPDNTTPGVYLAPSAVTNADSSLSPGDSWTVESQGDFNLLDIKQYYIHGSHAGDVVMWVYHVN